MLPTPFATEPVEPDPARSTGLRAIVTRRLTGRLDLDPWGLDPDVRALLEPLARLRWRAVVDGVDLLPAGPALVVHNQRFGVSERFVLATALHRATGRTTRPAGLADLAVVTPTLARAGFVPLDAADVRGLLRRGELVTLGLERLAVRRQLAGRCPQDPLAAAIAVGAPVVPAAVVGSELGRRWEVVVGAPVATRRGGGPAAPADLALEVRRRVNQLLEAAATGGPSIAGGGP